MIPALASDKPSVYLSEKFGFPASNISPSSVVLFLCDARRLFIRRSCMGERLRSASMIELYHGPTPNGHKITLFLEETGLPYQIVPLDISKGGQFKPVFLAFSPNNRMPAIIDRAPTHDGEAIRVFQSGAILVYLAEKSRMLLPVDLRGRKAAMEWLFWQVGGLGPMAGQNHHFNHYAPEKILYAIERHVKETNRLYGVLDRRLAAGPYLAGKDYSIADIAVYPWIVPWETQSQDLGHFPRPEEVVRSDRRASCDSARVRARRCLEDAARRQRQQPGDTFWANSPTWAIATHL
jgi:GSH-dependent disulfide-bond oxidoreductase